MLTSTVLAALLTAPVPPPPRELTPALLAGEWDYAWNSWADGRIVLCPDGTYLSRHRPHDPERSCEWDYQGRWWVERGSVLVLRERALSATPDTFSEYRLDLTWKDYPDVEGKLSGNPTLKLSGVRRFDTGSCDVQR